MKEVDYQYFIPLLESLESYMAHDKIELVKRAYEVAYLGHLGQTRSSGEPYITHPVEVAKILAELMMDYQAIQAAVMHDVIEDTPYTKNDLIDMFGIQVADMVEGVSKLDKLKFRNRIEAEAANFTHMIMKMTTNVRVALIKIADRLHNLRTIGSFRYEKQARIAQETFDIYCNIAGRLGIMSVKNELDDLSFKALHPNRYRIINKRLKTLKLNKENFNTKIQRLINKACEKQNIPSNTKIQIKSRYALYKSIKAKPKQGNNIKINNFIVIVKNNIQCYEVIGVLHNTFVPVPKQFFDYIAIPKTNGYQSLHTTLRSDQGQEFEVLIRTEEMDKRANFGILGNNTRDGENIDYPYINKWLDDIVQLQQSSANINEFSQSVKSDLFPSEIFVFTPQGKIIKIPDVATALDFAYYIHTEVGNSAVSAKVDGKEVPLSTHLVNGQTVEIITYQPYSSDQNDPPVPDINKANTPLAKSRIKQFKRNLYKSEAIVKGHYHLLGALNGKDPSKLPLVVIKGALEILSEESKREIISLEQLYEEIFFGTIISLVAANAIEAEIKKHAASSTINEIEEQHPNLYKSVDELIINRNFNIHPAECCCPIPGDDIVLSSKSGKGLYIHNRKCNAIKNIPSVEKISGVDWDNSLNLRYIAQLRIEINNRTELLGVVLDVINQSQAKIVNFSLETEGDTQLIIAQIAVHNLTELNEMLEQSQQRGVLLIERFINEV